MAHKLNTIRKRSTFIMVRNKGKMIKGTSFNILFFEDQNLENTWGEYA